MKTPNIQRSRVSISDLSIDESTIVSNVNSSVAKFLASTNSFFDPTSDGFQPVDLALYRAKKYFTTEDSVDENDLDIAARDQWLSSDWERRPTMAISSSAVRRVLYRARLLLQLWIADSYRYDLTNFDITSGETFTSANGKTSVYQKLKDKKYWTVTADCVDEAIKLVWKNRGLRSSARAHIVRSCDKLYRKRLTHFMRSRVDPKNLGFECFSVLMRLHVFTIVLGSRLETVPKDNTKRRTINVEPWFNVMCQRSIGLSLRKVSASVGNDLEVGQEEHKELISDRKYSTIDFSSASDSVLPSVVAFMFPDRIYSQLNKVRSLYTRYDKYDWHQPTLFSCMGNGYTFELMTLILLSIARVLDTTSRVYGDDVIVKNRVAPLFVECCSSIGFSVNTEKSFINSPFRESCGAFYHDTFGYMTSFKLERAQSVHDAIVLTNKLTILAKEFPVFREVCDEVQSHWPSLHKAKPPLDMSVLNTHVWCEDPQIGESERLLLKTLRRSVYERCNDLNLDRREIRLFVSWAQNPVTCSPFQPFVSVRNVAKLFFYIYSGRRTKDVLRNEYTTCPVIMVQYHGHVVRLKNFLGES